MINARISCLSKMCMCLHTYLVWCDPCKHNYIDISHSRDRKRGFLLSLRPDYEDGAILLSAHHYATDVWATIAHGNADVISWLPLPQTGREYVSEAQLCNLRQLEMLVAISQEIRWATRCDYLLSKVWEYTHKVWPNQVPSCRSPTKPG